MNEQNIDFQKIEKIAKEIERELKPTSYALSLRNDTGTHNYGHIEGVKASVHGVFKFKLEILLNIWLHKMTESEKSNYMPELAALIDKMVELLFPKDEDDIQKETKH